MDDQAVLFCGNCGTTFFADEGINRITHESAQNLLVQRRTTNLVTAPQFLGCPRDNTPLKSAQNTQAIPASVQLHMCPSCKGVLATANNLLKFKEAQMAKIHYYKVWGLPLGSLSTVFAGLALFVISASLLLGVYTIRQNQSLRSEASESIKNIDIIKTGPYLFVSFSTKQAVTSELVLNNLTQHSLITLPISTSPTKIHSITLSQPSARERIMYRLRLHNSTGGYVETEESELRF